MHSLKTASAIAFYFLGTCVITSIVLLSYGFFTKALSTVLHTLDLPLLASGMLYGGSSLILSLKRETVSMGLAIAVFGFLTIIFVGFVIFNFRFPFTPIF